LASAAPPARSASFVPPWGASGSGAEIRFITPHGGHGGIGYALSLVQPYVQQAPYGGPPALQLRAEAAGADLFDVPGGARAVGRLSAPLRLLIQETEALRMEPSHPSYGEHCDLLNLLSGQPPGSQCRGVLWGIWAKTTIANGLTGWVLVQVGPEGA
jgi:hypothetical protein